MQGFNLDEHSLLLKFSTGASKSASTGETSEKRAIKGTKLLIRNIPFEATKREIRKLFTPFAQVRIRVY